jgi:hypothetical protein
MATKSYGLTNWDKKHNKPQKKQDDDRVKIPFLRLNEGNNIIRIITAPAAYWNVRFKDNKSQFGTRVNCSDRILDDATKHECPTVQAGYKPKERYLVGVIDRSEGAVKLFDMSVLVYESLQGFKEDPEFGAPDAFDINVRFDPKASSPQGFYNVIARPPKPLTEVDINLIKSVSMDVIEENLVRLCTPPSVERVRAFLEKLGWDGKSTVETIKSNKSSGKELEEVTEQDYSFEQARA